MPEGISMFRQWREEVRDQTTEVREEKREQDRLTANKHQKRIRGCDLHSKLGPIVRCLLKQALSWHS